MTGESYFCFKVSIFNKLVENSLENFPDMSFQINT